MRSTRILAAAGLAAGLTGAGVGAATADNHDEATVSVLHGVPDATVDVYANGEALLEDFEPGTVTEPMSLPAGSYDLKVTEAGAGADGEAVIEANGVEVPGGENLTIAAHLDGEGTPALTPFVNDVSETEAGQGRVTVRHAAAAPAVDVRADGEVAFSGLENGDEDSAELPAGTVSADVVLAGEDEPVIGPADVEVAEGASTIVYAWGSAEDGNLDLAVQTLSAMSAAPEGVPAGTGGGKDGGVNPALVAGGAAALMVGAGALVLTRRREESA